MVSIWAQFDVRYLSHRQQKTAGKLLIFYSNFPGDNWIKCISTHNPQRGTGMVYPSCFCRKFDIVSLNKSQLDNGTCFCFYYCFLCVRWGTFVRNFSDYGVFLPDITPIHRLCQILYGVKLNLIKQYYGCRYTGSLRHQDISTHDINWVEYVRSCLTWWMISTICVMSVRLNDINHIYISYMSLMKQIACKGLNHCDYHGRDLSRVFPISISVQCAVDILRSFFRITHERHPIARP